MVKIKVRLRHKNSSVRLFFSVCCFHRLIFSYLRAARNQEDNLSVWMSGSPRALFFFVLAKDSVHQEPRLLKVAGDLQAGALAIDRCRYRRLFR